MPLLLSLLLVICTLMCAAGCSRPAGLTSDDAANPADQNKLPFQDNAAKGTGGAGSDSGAGNSRDANGAQAANRDGRPTGSTPFQTLSSIPELPPGTLVTVLLEKQISADRASAEATFTAVVDEPVLMDGKIAVPRGAFVTGEIESARASDVGPGRGYIRLTLNTITIAGKKLPLRTSTLFVRGTVGEVLSSDSAPDQDEPTSPSATHLQTGRRLTFRLAAMLPLFGQEATSSSQNPVPGTEQ